jgi:hypothetical protein
MTGLTLQIMPAHPSQELKDGIERVVKLVRSIEKTKIDEIVRLLRNTSFGKVSEEGGGWL